MSKAGNTVIHVILIEGGHHYFGSIAAIYDVFSEKTIGIKRHSLYNYCIDNDKPFINKKCIIRKGDIIRKKGNRKLPKY
jgi:hypothetical protein